MVSTRNFLILKITEISDVVLDEDFEIWSAFLTYSSSQDAQFSLEIICI